MVALRGSVDACAAFASHMVSLWKQFRCLQETTERKMDMEMEMDCQDIIRTKLSSFSQEVLALSVNSRCLANVSK